MIRNSHSIVIATAMLLSGSAAFAQGFDLDKPYNAQKENPLVTVIKDPGRTRPLMYRYTAGYKVQKGWEKTLVDGDPNLSHWTWMPVASYQQKYVRVEPGAFSPDRRKPAEMVPYKRSNGGHYVKPVCVQAPQNRYYKNWKPPVTAGGSRSTTDLNGKVNLPHQVVAQAAHGNSDDSTYSYGDISGRLTPGNDSGFAEKDVYGKLVSRGYTH